MRSSGETKRKKVDRQQEYYKSPAWAAKRAVALDRAGHRCEYVTEVTLQNGTYKLRCGTKERLQVHHKTNIRFGGTEIPEDLQVLCEGHHNLIERSLFPHRKHSRK